MTAIIETSIGSHRHENVSEVYDTDESYALHFFPPANRPSFSVEKGLVNSITLIEDNKAR